jgi:hypothetical protein
MEVQARIMPVGRLAARRISDAVVSLVMMHLKGIIPQAFCCANGKYGPHRS